LRPASEANVTTDDHGTLVVKTASIDWRSYVFGVAIDWM
jgi:hypothetical protein